MDSIRKCTGFNNLVHPFAANRTFLKTNPIIHLNLAQMMKKSLLILLTVLSQPAFCQVGIGTSTPDASAKLDVTASDKGFLPPRVSLTSTTDATTITTPAAGLLVYNTATAGSSPGNVTPGYYYYNGTSWSRLSTAGSLDGLSDAKSGGTDFSNSLLVGSRSTGTLSAATGNTGLGIGVFGALTSAVANSAIGWEALKSVTTSCCNNAFGYRALSTNTTGIANIAIGTEALTLNSVGSDNIGLGYSSLRSSTTGSRNVSMGSFSMYYSNSGNDNIAIGQWTLYGCSSGSRNIAIGANAISGPYSTDDNVCVGFDNLRNSNGNRNASLGNYSLYNNSSGSNNAAVGFNAMYTNTTGASNAAFGNAALITNQTGSYNTAIGAMADVTTGALTNTTAIGYNAKVAASNAMQLGNTDVTSVNTSASINAAAFNVTSDARLKENIQPLDEGLKTVLRLQPYQYEKKSGLSSTTEAIPEFGFLAQDILPLMPALVHESRDSEKTLSVNYTALIPVLTKAIQEQELTIRRLENKIEELNNRIEHRRSRTPKR
jgi:hypothetical protein